MSFLNGLRLACLGLALAVTSTFSTAASPKSRVALSSLVIQLDNGQVYSLTKKELQDKKGGAIFWGDWAVYNLLVPYYYFNRQNQGPDLVTRLWTLPGRSGSLPGFLLCTANGPVYPLDPGGPDRSLTSFSYNPRPAPISIRVALADGRSYFLTHEDLYDSKSGVMFWGDDAVNNILVPFYYFTPNLATSPADVLNLWNDGLPVPALSNAGLSRSGASATAAVAVASSMQPSFLLKPRCIPNSPLN